MSKKLRKVGVVVAMMALSLVAVAQASASTITISPAGATTASVSGTSNVAFLHIGTATLGCTGSTANATLSASTVGTLPLGVSPSAAPAARLDNTAGNVAIGFSGCRVAGLDFTVRCNNASNLVVRGTISGGVSGRITNISCVVRVTSTGCTATVADSSLVTDGGGADGTYLNTGSLTITGTAASQNLRVYNSTCTSIIPNGTATYTGPSSGPLTYAVTPVQRITIT